MPEKQSSKRSEWHIRTGREGGEKKKKRLVKEMGQKKITHRPGLTYGVEAGMDRAHSGTGRNGELTV